MLYATDSVALADVRVSDDGYLEGWARTARTGCQTYLGIEIGRPDISTVTIYRDEAAVFDRKSLESFAQIPVTVDHPPVAVTPKNWREHARGTTGTDVLRDGEFLKIGLKITDAAAIADVQSGKRQLSAGYTTDLIWGDGIAPDGTPYQARQTNIVANHIAIVSAGRAGAQCRIGDSWPAIDALPPPQPQQRTPAPMTERTIVVDGHSVVVSDAAAIAIGGLQRQNQTLVADNLQLTADLNTARTGHSAAITAKDAEIATAQRTIEAKDGEITALKKQLADAASPAALDAALVARDGVLAVAKAVIGDSFSKDGKTDAQIRREVVAHAMPDEAKTMSDAAVDGAFLAVARAKPRDQLRDAISGGIVPAGGTSMQDKAYGEMVAGYQEAWKPPAPRAA